jgi:branched-chain amino acid transport system permease protein
MTAFWQYVFSGLSVGCIYAFVALALVIVANVTGVFNFATGDYVMLGGMVAAVTGEAGWPLWLTVVAAVVVVTAAAVLQERLTVAPVRGKASPLGLVIGSLGVGVVIRGIALAIWSQNPRSAQPFQGGTFHILGASLQNQVKWIFLATAVSLILITLLFGRTDVGRAMRASAINPIAARLTGIKIGTTSLMAFAIAGAMCGLIASVSASTTLVEWDSGITIGLVGFIAAALAGFTSPVRAVIAGLALGVIQSVAAGEISTSYNQAIVYGTLVVYLLARDFYGADGIISRVLKSRRASAAGSQDAPELRAQIKQRVHAVEDHLLTSAGLHKQAVSGRIARLRGRKLSPMLALPFILLILAALFPLTTSSSQTLDTANFILLSAMAATGLGLVLGLAGQFSLGQGAFILISGYTAAILTANHHWSPLAALIVAVAVSVVMGVIIGWLTLRLEGLNLALATLAILEIALVFALQDTGLTGGASGVNGVPVLKLFGVTFQSQKSYFFLVLGVLAVMLLIARNLWRSRTGRTLRAIGIDQEAAESVGLNAWRLKLKIFVLAAAMAGVAGVLWSYYLGFASPDTWDVNLTIALVTYVVVGGVTSPYGGVVGAVVVGAIEYWAQQHIGSATTGSSSTIQILLSGALLIFFVLFFRSGLVSIPQLIAERFGKLRGRGAPEGAEAAEPERVEIEAPGELVAVRRMNGDPLRSETPLVVIDGLTKRFGSLIAVNGVSFSLRPGYITAMIGPNGAGKSTVINMLAGTLLPSDGAVGIMGRPSVGLQSQQIAQLGLARTFQTPRLFEGMTLLETVMLARDRYGSRSWLWGVALRTPRARRDEVESREQALTWLGYVGLGADADVPATSLTTGKQRLAELARALATEPTVLLLDEPAAGLDGGETQTLAAVIKNLADAGIAILLVEHDMGMVMSIADHVVVLEEGKKIAEGTAGEIGQNQTVIDAYLGVVHA